METLGASVDSLDDSLAPNIVNISDEQLTKERIPGCDFIKRFDVLPSYGYIFENYLLKNVPFIFGKVATAEWRSRQDWVTSAGKPNLEFLRENFGAAVVPVANCQQEKYSAQPKTDMTLGEYIQYWESYTGAGHPPHMESLYLKDWHFIRAFPHYGAYSTPCYFTSDWLNEFWDSRADEEDDFRFIYMGPKGSWTPLHADVFRSYSWSANVCGRKKWILFPPGEEENLKDNLGNLAYNVDSPILKDPQKYPFYGGLKQKFEVYQEAGEIIYVPSGWHHQVHNVMILKASSGIDFLEFYGFICTIAENRLQTVKTNRLEVEQDASKLENENQSSHGEEFQKGESISQENNNDYDEVLSDENTTLAQKYKSSCSLKTADELNQPSNKRDNSSCNMLFQDGCPVQLDSSAAHNMTNNFKTHCAGQPEILNFPSKHFCNKDSDSETQMLQESVEQSVDSDSHPDKPPTECVPEIKLQLDDSNISERFVRYQASQFSKSQVLFDIRRLNSVLVSMMTLEDFSSLDFSECSVDPQTLLESLRQVLDSELPMSTACIETIGT